MNRWVTLSLVVITAHAGSSGRGRAEASAAASADDSLGLVAAASRAYDSELAAMSAYARAACGECPAEAPLFLAGSRHAFELATRVYPQDPKAFLGLANVLFSTSFRGDGEPIDSTLRLAQQVAERALALASTDSVRAVAESLLTRIKRAH